MKLVGEFLGYLENAKKENEVSKLGWTAGTVADASLITFIIYHLTVAVCVRGILLSLLPYCVVINNTNLMKRSNREMQRKTEDENLVRRSAVQLY